MKKIKLKDIAREFKVSISTASKAVNDSSEISESLRKKIQNYAVTHHYKPNKVALSLRNKSTKTIGVLLPNILNYFFTQVFYGIEKITDQRGYKIISCMTNESYDKEVTTSDLLHSGTIDGLLISLSQETQQLQRWHHLERLKAQDIPIVMFDRVTDQITCDKVIVDDVEAAYKATQYLLQTGCKNIVLFSTIHHSSVGKLRVKGYKKALQDHQIAIDDRFIVPVSKRDDPEILITLLLNYKPIHAIIALDEISAITVLKTVQARGYKVPDDISIIGFTNGILSRHVTPALTTVSQHGKFIGESAATILIDRIEQKNKSEEAITKIVKTSLIIRESTKVLLDPRLRVPSASGR